MEFWCSDARHELLAGAAFAVDQDRRAARRGLDDQVEDLSHRRTAADDGAEAVGPRLQILAQRPVLGDEAPLRERVAQHDQDFLVLERLGDVVVGAALHRRDGILDRRERRDHQHRHVVVYFLELVERGDAVHAGHHHVHDRGVERHRLRQLEPLGGVLRQPYVVALPGQKRLQDLPHDLLVVDDEDRPLADRSGRRLGVHRSPSHAQACLFARASAARENADGRRKRESSSLTDAAVAGDGAAVLLDDSVGDGETEAGPLADVFRREERIVDAREVIRRDARSGIGHLDHRLAARARHDRQPAAFRHGVTRIEEQVQEDLLQLVLDALHQRRHGRQFLAHLDAAGAKLMLEERQHVVDHRVHVDRTAVDLRRPRQIEQAVDDLRRAERLFLDLLEHLRRRIVWVGPLQQHLRVARDAGERRVDFVRDPGREQAE